jgi:hypothetical protein
MRRYDRFILDRLAFELPDAGEHLGLKVGAVVNDGFERFGDRRGSECGDGCVLFGHGVFQPSLSFPASV